MPRDISEPPPPTHSVEPASEPVTWTGTTPVSPRFGDPYFSLEDGLAEARHVFIAGNSLPQRLRSASFGPLHVAELGFGTGLNLLATVQAFQAAGAASRLRFTSFEAFPLPAPAMQAALAPFPELAPLATRLLGAWGAGERRFTLAGAQVEVIAGDARRTLPLWPARADAWFLDGFAPARNPQLWEPDLLAQVAAHTSPGGTFATYTAAGAVRRALAQAGFDVERVPGYGRKRHMSRGSLKDPR